MTVPKLIVFRDRQYRIVTRDEETKNHYLPKYRGKLLGDGALVTSCKVNIERVCEDGTRVKRDVTCAECRKILGMKPYPYFHVRA